MTRPTYNLSLRDRNLIRLERHERIENFHAQRMAQNGDVELFEMESDMDDDYFPYPFGKVGMRKIDSLNISDKGRAHLSKLYESKRRKYDAYQSTCRVIDPQVGNEQILYTPQGVVQFVTNGKRDHLVVFNKKVEDDNYIKLGSRSLDPDTGETLMSEDEIDAQIDGFDLAEDEAL